MIEKISKGNAMTDTAAEYPKDEQFTTPERVVDESREKVIMQIAELAVRLENLTHIERAIQNGDEDVVRMLGHWANQITTTLDDDTWKTDAEVIILVPRKETPVLADMSSEEPEDLTADANDIAKQEGSEVEVQAEYESEVSDLSRRGRKWLVEGLGEEWSEILGVDTNASVSDIAAAIASRIKDRSQTPAGRSQRRIEYRLKGISMSKMIVDFPDDNDNNAAMFLSKVLERAKNQKPSKPPKKIRVAKVKQPVAVRQTPRGTAIAKRLKEIEDGFAEEITVVHELPARKPKHEVLPRVSHETISLLVAEKVGLSTVGRIEFAMFLDPISHAPLSSSRLKAIEAVRDAIRDKIDDETYELSAQERIWVHRCFGAYERQGVPNDQEPLSVRELSKPSWSSSGEKDVAGFIFGGLTKIFK